MEIRVLQYFLAVIREQNISAAAESLHLTQPTLSRQLKDLEDELGKQLFIRSNRKITLTEEGLILKKRAEEMMSLLKKTEAEIAASDRNVSGDVYIGCGESFGMHGPLRIARKLQTEYPDVHFHVVSGDRENVLENLDRGLIDFGVVFGDIDTAKYEYIPTAYKDSFGVLMKKDDPLSKKAVISVEDLIGLPLIVSRQTLKTENAENLFGKHLEKLNIVSTYNLLFNGSIMVEEGIGYAIGFDRIVNTSRDGRLIFRPLEKQSGTNLTIIWKKYQVFGKAAQKYLELLKDEMG